MYLRIQPEVSFQRVKKRNQTGDNHVSLKLLMELHEKHEQFVSTLVNENVAVIEISNGKTISETVFDFFLKISPTIIGFIEST